jgi:hypothetical protein
VIFPLLAGVLPARALVASQDIPRGARLATTETVEPSFIWYLRKHSRTRVERISEAGILAFLGQGQEAAVVLVNKPSTPLLEGYQMTSVSGLNLAKGRWERYSLVRSSDKKSRPSPTPPNIHRVTGELVPAGSFPEQH